MTFKEDLAKKLTETLGDVDLYYNKDPGNKKYPLARIASDQSKLSIGFNQEALNIISRCIDDILDHKLNTYGPLYLFLDADYIQKLLIQILVCTKTDPNTNKYNLVLGRIGIFFKNLKISTYLCYIKIGNMKTKALYDFGSFRIFPNNKTFLDEILDLQNLVKDHPFLPIQKNSDVLSTIMEVKVYAVDPNQASVKALHLTTDFLNAFKIFRAKGLFYEGHSDSQYHDVYIVNTSEGTQHRINGIEKSFTMVDIFDLDGFAVANPKLIIKLQTVFDLENSTALEKKIMNSLIWYGESIYEPNYSHRLLKMMIAIESLLLDDNDRGTKSYLLEERVAFLLSDTFEVRSMFADIVKEAYQVRNNIVHNGEKQPVPIRLIKYLMLIASESNLKLLLSDQYTDLKDIKREVHGRKYQKPIDAK